MKIIINDTLTLVKQINKVKNENFIAIDTEFIRESTYFSKLCLVQIATEKLSFIIDALSPKINLDPLWELLKLKTQIKVMHSCRQDIEIFYKETGQIPCPIFDTQIAAMVCGYGDQIGYDQLVKSILDIKIDKSIRVSDWSFRPLNNKQLDYALADVIYLAKIYPLLKSQIEKNKRDVWIRDEMSNLSDKEYYSINPDRAWEKIKVRSSKGEFLNRIKFLASWREKLAIKKDIPKNRIIRDETILDIASTNPKTISVFDRIRGMPGGSSGKLAPDIISVLYDAEKVKDIDFPSQQDNSKKKLASGALLELLKVLLKFVSEKEKVAPKLLASQSDLEKIALGKMTGLKTFSGWRNDIFGKYAINLSQGKLGITSSNNKIKLFEIK